MCRFVLIMFSLSLLTACAGAPTRVSQQTTTPQNKAQIATVKIATLSAEALQEAIKSEAAIHVFDVNSAKRYRRGHIATAKHVNRRALTYVELPKDRQAKLVFYCGSARCKASHKAAMVALAMGYTQVSVMPDGIKGWEAAGRPVVTGGDVLPFGVMPAKFVHQKMQGAAQLHIVDMNSAARYEKGHLPGARHGRPDLSAALPVNKDAKVIVYCGSPRCGASHKAAAKATSLGYSQVFVMPEGIKGWTALGLPVTLGATINRD